MMIDTDLYEENLESRLIRRLEFLNVLVYLDRAEPALSTGRDLEDPIRAALPILLSVHQSTREEPLQSAYDGGC
jgi:hypothetical protein